MYAVNSPSSQISDNEIKKLCAILYSRSELIKISRHFLYGESRICEQCDNTPARDGIEISTTIKHQRFYLDTEVWSSNCVKTSEYSLIFCQLIFSMFLDIHYFYLEYDLKISFCDNIVKYEHGCLYDIPEKSTNTTLNKNIVNILNGSYLIILVFNSFSDVYLFSLPV